MAEFGLFADFYRPPFKHWPPLFSKEGWKFMKQSFAESYRGIWSFIMVKYNLNGWKKAKFAKEAEDLYKVMNEAYAQGDLVTIESICMPMLYGKMKADIKRRQTDFDWEVVQSVSKPKVIKIRCGNVAPKVSIGQVTVRIDQIQRVAPVPRSGGGGGPKRLVHAKNAKPRDTHVVEYLVFQRLLKDEFSPWLLYKKINVPEWDLPKQKK
ncbi:hypothetical protein IW140_002161 [Coemansia sp. RSA 1813]|nr:hypothetical protein EV178_001310 [Coemansia sp. RSA 1646]KAJ2090198.1 hypothetical protein IW138_002830 [Coemansia sp. RSA 986]KAJ2570735.1 hypothetical protein IW140_002161 [Coemansia sp. RSA 1813]